MQNVEIIDEKLTHMAKMVAPGTNLDENTVREIRFCKKNGHVFLAVVWFKVFSYLGRERTNLEQSFLWADVLEQEIKAAHDALKRPMLILADSPDGVEYVKEYIYLSEYKKSVYLH